MIQATQDKTHARNRLPSWFKQEIPEHRKINRIKTLMSRLSLHTVCEEARCPNLGTCWGQGVATFLILGKTCSRCCRFCAVQTGTPSCVDPDEPEHVARAVQQLNLSYVVVTSVTRDDLEDGGSQQFVKTVYATRRLMPRVKIELLIPDFRCRIQSLKELVVAQPEVISHNIETVQRLYSALRPGADYEQSFRVLRTIKEIYPSGILKSGFMVGLGETEKEVEELMRTLLAVGCDILTIGQYLAPHQSQRHWPVKRFVSPQEKNS